MASAPKPLFPPARVVPLGGGAKLIFCSGVTESVPWMRRARALTSTNKDALAMSLATTVTCVRVAGLVAAVRAVSYAVTSEANAVASAATSPNADGVAVILAEKLLTNGSSSASLSGIQDCPIAILL